MPEISNTSKESLQAKRQIRQISTSRAARIFDGHNQLIIRSLKKTFIGKTKTNLRSCKDS
jgi:hypothetical protein